MVVGKPITFTSTHSLPPSDDVPRDIGAAELNGVDIASELLKNGWAKLKDLKRDPTEEDLRKKDLEAEARAAGKGVWNPHGPKVRSPASASRVRQPLIVRMIGTQDALHDAHGFARVHHGVEGPAD